MLIPGKVCQWSSDALLLFLGRWAAVYRLLHQTSGEEECQDELSTQLLDDMLIHLAATKIPTVPLHALTTIDSVLAWVLSTRTLIAATATLRAL
jgi:hypothetical protein